MSVRRLLSATAAGLIALALLGGCSGNASTSREEASGIEFDLPDGWNVQAFGRYCRRVGPGVLISNVDREFSHPEMLRGCTSAWKLAAMPADLVLADVSAFSGGPPGRPAAAELPEGLGGFRSPPDEDPYCPACELRVADARIGGESYIVRVWFGRRASREDRDAMEAVIQSLRFPG